MSEGIQPPKLPESIIRDVLGFWVNRHEARAVHHAGSLTFWRDGMLKNLELIANGKATDGTYAALAKEFKETAEPVALSLRKLSELRSRVSGNIANQIDVILNDPRFGKNTVRDNIEYLLHHHKHQDSAATAKWLCSAIETLNAQILRLERLVRS